MVKHESYFLKSQKAQFEGDQWKVHADRTVSPNSHNRSVCWALYRKTPAVNKYVRNFGISDGAGSVKEEIFVGNLIS